jgi:hypothetical protein
VRMVLCLTLLSDRFHAPLFTYRLNVFTCHLSALIETKRIIILQISCCTRKEFSENIYLHKHQIILLKSVEIMSSFMEGARDKNISEH